jgi:hypothetical protein
MNLEVLLPVFVELVATGHVVLDVLMFLLQSFIDVHFGYVELAIPHWVRGRSGHRIAAGDQDLLDQTILLFNTAYMRTGPESTTRPLSSRAVGI